jgi:hypothetical protein
MFSFHRWIYAFAALYGVLGIVFYRLSRRPTCRLCFYRSFCPNRIGGLPQFLREPKCVAAKKNEAAGSLPETSASE